MLFNDNEMKLQIINREIYKYMKIKQHDHNQWMKEETMEKLVFWDWEKWKQIMPKLMGYS